MADFSDDAHTPARRAARGFETAVGWASRIAIRVSGLTCLATLALVCYAIAARYFFNNPQAWSDEAVGWLVVVTVMLALPEAQRRGEHIGVDALIEKLGARARRFAAMFGIACVAAVAYLFVTEGIETVLFTRMIGIFSNELPQIPLWMVQALIPIGGALLLLVTVAQLVCHLAGIEPQRAAKTRPDALE